MKWIIVCLIVCILIPIFIVPRCVEGSIAVREANLRAGKNDIVGTITAVDLHMKFSRMFEVNIHG